ncbi:LptF/LptG family permease [Hydrocarboniphaga sp.]|uniref:LptF/LptG family permease n=1 Tax=Hydrocarboniphaga sp. TaxID=2033016 RepID=UPI003D0F5555
MGRVERYLLRLLWPPLTLSLGVVLLALVLERLLRLFDLVATGGSALEYVLLMVINLIPYYLGLALPAAFFASIFMVVARLGEDNELDAMLAAGRSIAELTKPFLLLALVLTVFGLYLYGFLQPGSRYRYREVMYEALHSGWNARVQENVFADAGRGFVLTSDKVDGSGRVLTDVFIRRKANGIDEVTTSDTGHLIPTADGKQLVLQLGAGRIVRESDDGQIEDIHFTSGYASEDFSVVTPPFRARGDSERELTSTELWAAMHAVAPPQPYSELAGEFHGRLVRSFSLPLLPLLAFPLGMAAKRGRRAPGVVIACLMLLFLHHGVQLGESLAETGRFPVIPAVWTPFVLFSVISIWLFRGSLNSPGENPVTRAVAAVENLIGGINLRKKKKPAANNGAAS